jgi:uncharacterized membrane protein YfcA
MADDAIFVTESTQVAVRRVLPETKVEGGVIKPFISAYLLIMGVIIIVKAFRNNNRERKITTHIAPLGLIGGFFDAIGGGGWGPIVTTTLVARGNNPRYSIGSVNFSEFFVTLAESITFILTLSLAKYWLIILGLLVGGATAAPLAASLTKKIPARVLMALVGALIIALSLRTIILSWPNILSLFAWMSSLI